MITYISLDNIDSHKDAIKAQYKLRHKAFLERQSYKVFSYKDMEYDQYDNPSAVYLVHEGAEERDSAWGVSRLTPVSHRSMLQDLYPSMVDDHAIFSTPNVWEGTRFCVEKSLDSVTRMLVSQELVGAYFEFGLLYGVRKVIGMMPTFILRRVFQASGCTYEHLGPSFLIDKQRIQAASMDITQQNFNRFRQKTGIHHQIIQNLNVMETIAA